VTLPAAATTSECLELFHPQLNRSVVLGSNAFVIEDLSDLYSGPASRGVDSENIYRPGSTPGARASSAAEYTISVVILGTHDVDGDLRAHGKTERQQIIENLDALKSMNLPGVAGTVPGFFSSSMLNLRWYGRAIGADFARAFVHMDYNLQTQWLGTTGLRVVLTFTNPFGVWYGAQTTITLSFDAGTDVTQTASFAHRGNTVHSNIVVFSTGPQTKLEISQPFLAGFSTAPVVTVERASGTFNNLVVRAEEQAVTSTTAAFPSIGNPATDNANGFARATTLLWLVALPQTTTTYTIKRTSTDSGTVRLLVVDTYV